MLQCSIKNVTPRDLPSVHQILEKLDFNAPHSYVVDEIRRVIEAARGKLLRGEELPEPVEITIGKALAAWTRPSIRQVINATGVILHTNLGRAPLAPFNPIAGYSTLEYDLEAGKRGKRDAHTERITKAILGKPAIIVNNNAAAIFLIMNELAAEHEAIVSRGELIEIGDGFRIPEIIERSGATLREVGTTNRTQIDDYRNAINERTRVLLRVHPSNFRMTGFTARAELSELVQLGRERGIPVYEDLGSGCLVDLRAFGIDEPLAQDSLAAGVDLVSFSGDKLLGGPQAGIIAGNPDLVARVRRNPLYRAVRQDKLFYQAMETTLRHILLGQLDEIPALRMIRMSADVIKERAERVAKRIEGAVIEAGESVIGGGSTPDLKLPTWVIALRADERRLRANDPPIIVRMERDRVLIDLRTVLPEQEDAIVQALS
jgi:L-seryl-tRNA(Ser) seleniumtransferase